MTFKKGDKVIYDNDLYGTFDRYNRFSHGLFYLEGDDSHKVRLSDRVRLADDSKSFIPEDWS